MSWHTLQPYNPLPVKVSAIFSLEEVFFLWSEALILAKISVTLVFTRFEGDFGL
jgi:hypothetical protein